MPFRLHDPDTDEPLHHRHVDVEDIMHTLDELIRLTTEGDRQIMAEIDTLNTDLSTLQTSVNALLTAFQAADQDPAIAAADTTVNAINTAIQSVLNPPAPTPVDPTPEPS